MNEQFNWYEKPTGTQRYTTLTRVQKSEGARENESGKKMINCHV